MLAITIDFNKASDATIIFLPLHKKIMQPTKMINPQNAQPLSSESSSEKTASPLPHTPLKKSTQPETKIVTSTKSATSPKKKSKEGRRKIKAAKKKAMPENRELPTSEKKSEQKPPLVPKHAEKVTEPENKQPSTPSPLVPPSAQIQSSTHASEQITGTMNAIENAIFIGQDDLAALQAQQAISHDIAEHFKPPAGLKKGLQCQLKLMVEPQGRIVVTIEQSSGVKLFDIQARLALQKITVASWLHGKELRITLKN